MGLPRLPHVQQGTHNRRATQFCEQPSACPGMPRSIEYLQPNCWFIENPDSGLLKTRPCIEGLPYQRVDYCMYSNCPYRKRTRIWTNCTDWTPKMCDRSHCINGRHAATAQRGCKKGDRRSGDQTFTRDELHRLPKELCEELFSVCCTIPESFNK